MMEVAIIKIIMLRNIVIMITMIDKNDSYRNPHEIYDEKDDNKDDKGDSSDNNDDQIMNAQIIRHIYMEDF